MRKNHTEIESAHLFSLSELYHEKSKLRDIDYGHFVWMNHVNSAVEIRKIINSPCLKYKGFDQVQLSKPASAQEDSEFRKIIKNRASSRSFAGTPVTFDQLSAVLRTGNGVTHSVDYGDGVTFHHRSTPSGGGLYPIELFCAAQQVDGLASGIYAYTPLENSLYSLWQEEKDVLTQQLIKGMQTIKDGLEKSAAVIYLVAHIPRMKFKYKERAYRFALIECGHIAQNILLAAEYEGLGAIPIGGYIDDTANELLRLDGLEEFVLYCIVLGNKVREQAEEKM